MADEQQGALSQLGGTDITGVLSKLAQDPIDQNRGWLAYAAGALSPTKSGSSAEGFGNALAAMNEAQKQQEALRASYVPHVTQALLKAAEFEQQRRLMQAGIDQIARESGMAPPSTLTSGGNHGNAGGTSQFDPNAPVYQGPQIPPGARIGGGLLRPGMSPGVAQLSFANDPKGYLANWQKQFDPTELEKKDTYLGISPQQSRSTELAERVSKANGQVIDANGNAVLVPNYAKNIAEVEGGKTEANIQATNRNTLAPLELLKKSDGKYNPKTIGQIVDGATDGGNANQEARYQGQDLLEQLPGNVRADLLANARKTGESQFGVNYQLPNGRVVRGQVDLAAPVGGSQQSGQGSSYGQSTVEEQFQKSLGTTMGKDITEGQKKAEDLAEGVRAIDKSLDLIQKGAILGSGADLKTDTAKVLNNVFGMEISPDKVSNTDFLKSTLGIPLLAKARSLGVNPTDADAKRLDTILGTIGKDPNALPELLKFNREISVRAIEQHNKRASGISAPYPLTVDVPPAYVSKVEKPQSPAPMQPSNSGKVDYQQLYGVRLKK